MGGWRAFALLDVVPGVSVSVSVSVKTPVLATLALGCFAANSLLCREALSSGDVDAITFTTLRLVAGGLALAVLARGRKRVRASGARAVALCAYALLFSFAYTELTAATGALVLFAAVQATMLVGAVRASERLSLARWGGIVLAMAGVSYLLMPGIQKPGALAAVAMLGSGVAWGIYSLLGRRSVASAGWDPLLDTLLSSTARDFLLASLPALAISAMRLDAIAISPSGAVLAVASGAFTSGVGYALWFAALRGFTPSGAAVVQLAVPVLAGLGGAVFLSEPLSARLVAAALVVLSGIALSLSAPSRTTRGRTFGGARESRREESPHAVHRREAPASTA